MCLKAVLRKILAFVAVLGEFAYVILSIAFHMPFAWYQKRQMGLTTRWELIGGLWTYCYAILGLDKQEWKCKEIDKKAADWLKHEWGSYQSMKVFVIISELIALVCLAFFYFHVCAKSWKLGVLTVILTALQFVGTMISSSLAQSTYSEAFGDETDASWSLYLIWLCWMASLANLVLAVVVCIVAYLDK